MLIQVVDANGNIQQVVAQAPTTPTDRSGTGTGASQVLVDAIDPATAPTRSGWLVQNNSLTGNSMTLNDLGDDADNSPTCIVLQPGASFPPPGYPVTQGQISILAALGDNYAAREW